MKAIKLPKLPKVHRKKHIQVWQMFLWPSWETYMWTIGTKITAVHITFFVIQIIVVCISLFEFEEEAIEKVIEKI